MVAVNADKQPLDLQAREAAAADQETQPVTTSDNPIQDVRNQETGNAPAYTPESSAPEKKTRGKVTLFKLFGRPFKVGLGGALLAGGIPIALIIAAVALLVFLAGYLKIPNLASNITEYEFGSFARQVNANVNRSVQEKLAVDTADDNLFAQIKSKYKGLQDGFDEKFLQKFTPRAAIRVLQANDETHMRFNYSNPSVVDGLLGRQSLESIELNGKLFTLPPQRGFIRSFVPKMLDIDYLKKQANFVKEFSPTLAEALKTSGAGGVPAGALRSGLSTQLLNELGINRITWIVGRYKASALANEWNKNSSGPINEQVLDTAARLETESEIHASMKNPLGALDSNVPDLKQQAEEVVATIEEEVSDPKKLQRDIDNGGVSKAVTSNLETTVGDSALSNVVSFVNPVYGIALPACIIYEGSLEKSGPSINASIYAQQAAFFAIAAGANQLQAGGVSAEDAAAQNRAISGLNAKLADTTLSIASKRASGYSYNTDQVSIHPETGATQTYTLIDATPGLGGSGVGNAIKAIASNDKVCPALTDIRVGIAGAAASVVLDVITADTAGAGTVLTDNAIQAFLRQAGTKLTRAFIGETVTKGIVASKLRGYVLKFAGDALRVTFLTVAAKLVVLARSGEFFNGLEQGADFSNEADSGGNIHAGELCRTQAFCRPLTCLEQAENAPANQKFIAQANSRRSISDRYFALSNADSLLNRTAMITASTVSSLQRQPVLQTLGTALASTGTIIASLTGTAHAASSNCASQNYGNVQFGWSADENKLVDSNTSYLPLENQQILDQSGKEAEIAQKFSRCFGYDYNTSGTSFDPTDANSRLQLAVANNGDASLGMLLQNGDIVRTTEGDIVPDQGLCSPQNLSFNNPQYGDLVLRFRQAMAYEASIKQVIDQQTVPQ